VSQDRVVFSVRNVDFFYGKKQALFGVTLDIPRQRITALIGPSGCGKSTFIRLLNRMNDFIPNTSMHGEILFEGEDIYDPRTDVLALRKRVGMVFQRPNPFPVSIYDNVAYGLRLHGRVSRVELDEIVERSLRWAALWDEVKDRLHQSAFSLSGGQQQRLVIARALALHPEVLLLDEPTSALDPISTAKIEELLYELKSRLTVVIVTHNMQQAARISDTTAFFLNGYLVEVGPTPEIFQRPQKKETEDYVAGRFG